MSAELTIDATSFSKYPMSEESVQIQLSSPFAGEVSDYTFKFKSDVPIRSGEKCFVKMTIPPELDFSQVDLNDILTKGMLVDAAGKKITKVSDSEIPSWVMLEGCDYTGDSENFEKD